MGGAWCLLHIVLFFHFGIVTGFESRKYIEQADHLLQNGTYASPNFLFYSTEILLIAATKKWQVGYWLVVAVQLLFNLFSTYAFYKTVVRFTNRSLVAFFFTLAFVGMFYYQLYNVHLFTESLYFSFSVIFFWGLVRVQKLSPLAVGGILFGLTLLYLTRPVGIFFIPATFIYILFRFYSRLARLLLFIAGMAVLGLFYFLLNKSLNAGGEFDFLLPYLDERVICGVPTIWPPHQIATPVEKDSVEGLFYIITHYWPLFLSLSVKRLLAFFGVLRSYYSLPHNVFIGFYFYSVYVLAFAGIRNWTSPRKPCVFFCVCLVFLTALTSALSCDEWHNRFILAVLPFLLLLASLIFAPKNRKSPPDAEPATS